MVSRINLRRLFLVSALLLFVLASTGHAAVRTQATNPPPETIAPQLPAVPATRPPVAEATATTPAPVSGPEQRESGAEPQPTIGEEPGTPDSLALAETGLLNLDLLFTALAVLLLGAGLLLGAEPQVRTD